MERSIALKPSLDQLAVVTCTIDPVRARLCFESWQLHSRYHLPVYMVWSELPPVPAPTTAKQRRELDDLRQAGCRVLLDTFAPGVTIDTHHGGGVVPAFAQGVARAFADGADAVICLHDDVEILEPDWDHHVLYQLARGVKFAGFGGATSLGARDLYKVPYDPMQLARGGFVSNMRDAEAHGRRSTRPVPCVCFDGFCQIGTKDWFGQAWEKLNRLGIIHHFYDGMLGCLAAQAGVQPGLMIPVACHHLGGQTAVGSEAYQAWAKTRYPGGDHEFWVRAHQMGYDAFRDVLPLRIAG